MSTVKKILLVLMIAACTGGNAFAFDNVLQAIQINGEKDSYNIILKSDDVAEMKKTIQAPNKMIINLKGIRASKTINTIYNNTSTVDSVVVEPIGNDAVKILVQAANVASAEVHFDSLKTPLGVLGNTSAQSKPADEIVLSEPMNAYTPVYDKNQPSEDTGFAFDSTGGVAAQIKNVLKNDKVNWLVTFGLFSIFLMSGMKLVKGKDNEIKIGLSQSLKEREIELYRNNASNLGANLGVTSELSGAYPNGISNSQNTSHNATGLNYGLRAYQQGTRNPYLTSETQKIRPSVSPVQTPVANLQQAVKTAGLKPAMQSSMQNTIQKTAPAAATSKTANIDSMKFLESMTKIYEKNGRSDLAQGLKTNMKKAKMNLV